MDSYVDESKIENKCLVILKGVLCRSSRACHNSPPRFVNDMAISRSRYISLTLIELFRDVLQVFIAIYEVPLAAGDKEEDPK